MRAEEAERFYEEDEDPKEVFAIFDAAEKSRTAPPTPPSGKLRPSRWAERLRHEIAGTLRWAANIVESARMRAR